MLSNGLTGKNSLTWRSSWGRRTTVRSE